MQMKTLTVVMSVLFLTTLAACGHFSFLPSSHPKWIADPHFETSPLAAFLAVTEGAAEQIKLDESLSDWQTKYDNAKHMSDLLPNEALSDAQQKECDSIMEQMELGKLAIELKRIDPRTGKKQCNLVSAEILKHVKNLKKIGSKAKT
jgi:hypothetical protein